MSQRASGYARRPHEHYPTPAWVVDALAEHVDLGGKALWEPACGEGQMVAALRAAGAGSVYASDVADHGFAHLDGLLDFTAAEVDGPAVDGIVTNPPFGVVGRTAEAFIRAGLRHLRPGGFLTLLLPVDFDSAKTRAPLFRDCPAFAAKIVLTRRIVWFERPAGEEKASPSANHAWFVWERSTIGARQAPRILYAPTQRPVLEAAE